jgi:hypothetical protein
MSRLDWLAVVAWAVLLALVLVLPTLTHSADPGDDLTRHTVRVSLAFYTVAAGLMLVLRPDEWPGGRARSARLLWSLSWLAYLVHLGMAFHYYHRWSHAAAVEHVQKRSGFGEGIYVSHLFTLVWTLDVLFWWLRPQGYAGRSPWFDRLLHGFMAFMLFNATVVYEQGVIRWAGVVLFAVVGPLWLRRIRVGRSSASPVPRKAM